MVTSDINAQSQATLHLIVVRCDDIEITRAFYESLNVHFTAEQHGKGPLHYSATFGELVLELYPGTPDVATRLGFRVRGVREAIDRALLAGGALLEDVSPGPWEVRAVLRDPDGRSVELVDGSFAT